MTLNNYIKKQLFKEKISVGTYQNIRATLSSLDRFNPSIQFSEINGKLIRDFENSLKVHPNTIRKMHGHLEKYLLQAQGEGIVFTWPYYGYRKPGKKTIKEPPGDTIINKVKELTGRDRDVVISAAFTGLSSVEILRFNGSWVSEVDGMKIIKGVRQKTGEKFVIPVFPEAEVILNYKDGFGIKDYTELLKVFKEVGEKVNFPLTPHLCRYYCGTYLLNKGMVLSEVQRILGHNSISTTERYAKMNDNTVINAARRLL